MDSALGSDAVEQPPTEEQRETAAVEEVKPETIAREVADDDEELAVRLKSFLQSDSNPNCTRAVVFECSHRYIHTDKPEQAPPPSSAAVPTSSSSDATKDVVDGHLAVALQGVTLAEAKLRVRYSNCTIAEEEMRTLVNIFQQGRDFAIRKGMVRASVMDT